MRGREEQLVGTVSFRRDFANEARELRAEARQATRDVLHRMLDSGQLDDGMENADREQRVQRYLGLAG